ncbi:hypothetical protein chiPu_0030991, partial [Chiloscyllium punctatum]|nr:hypothetical protein [Chiloscyllium punctatum]
AGRVARGAEAIDGRRIENEFERIGRRPALARGVEVDASDQIEGATCRDDELLERGRARSRRGPQQLVEHALGEIPARWQLARRLRRGERGLGADIDLLLGDVEVTRAEIDVAHGEPARRGEYHTAVGEERGTAGDADLAGSDGIQELEPAIGDREHGRTVCGICGRIRTDVRIDVAERRIHDPIAQSTRIDRRAARHADGFGDQENLAGTDGGAVEQIDGRGSPCVKIDL